MRQIISVFAIAGAALVASCNTSEVREQRAALQAQQAELEAMKMDLVKQRTIDSMNAVADAKKPTTTTVVRSTTPRRSYSSSSNSDRAYTSGSSSYNGAGYSQPTVTQPAVYQPAPVVQQQKRGWSAKAKGAVIGAGVGAASGAIINKRNRGVGAIIGAVGGAAAGTGIGAILDRKNGR